ncbi:hypothetical protein ACQKLP_22000 [Chitinophaga sp. NPDC101104]|uniref:hypothetical protein n=1 Tax=Chitinophaga sp. NPDC101104 TaxID=3390561 RepID=UPI003D0086AA
MRFTAKLYIAACFVISQISCKNEPDKICPDIHPVATFNAGVDPGETLILSITGIDDAIYYHWYGPLHFSSHEKSPSIRNASGFNSGVYSVDIVTENGCRYTAHTDSLAIMPVELPCSLPDNTGGFANWPFAKVDYVNNEIIAAQYQAETTRIRFRMGDPLPGIYAIEKGEVHVSMENRVGNFTAQDGKVYVLAENGKRIVQFCQLAFTYTDYYGQLHKSVGSARILF